ncbi:MAG: TonB-dependent receptor [Gemmatimonadetes bacterium]|nr:TonB-dependent receptor [Gemmatimonadota bacterium]
MGPGRTTGLRIPAIRAISAIPAVLVAWLGAASSAAYAQTGSVSVSVRDSSSGTAVDGARVELLGREGVPSAAGQTDQTGSAALLDVPPGSYALRVSRIGYEPLRLVGVNVRAGADTAVAVRLLPRVLLLNPLVVTASRSRENRLDAPASVTVVEGPALTRRPALTVIDHVRGMAGVDAARSGLVQQNVVVRGFNNAASGALLTLADYRYATIPSLRINAYNFIPITNDDLDRIELVRGPGAALYGPNSAGGVLHLISRSPFDSRGTTIALSGGQRSVFQGSLRHASALGPRVGFKVSGQFQRGRDWPYQDPTEVANRAVTLASGARPDTLRVGRRDPDVARLAGEARLDLRTAGGTTGVLSFGVNDALKNVDITGVGAAQVLDWRYWYAQGRVRRGRLFAQAFLNASDAGDTYLLRTGGSIVDRSRLLAGQLQHGFDLGGRHWFTYGVDAQRTDPRTGGTINGRNEDDDVIQEAGAYLHSQTTLAAPLSLVAAARLDYHNRLQAPVLSPRLGLVWRPVPLGALRLTYNRAFNTPSTNDLFLDLVADSLRIPGAGTALPFAIRVLGVPVTGFTFARDCNGLCMRSPFTPAALGGPGRALPADVTLLWAVLVDTLRSFGIDLSAVPAPLAGQVKTDVRLLSTRSGRFEPIDPAALTDLPRLKSTITESFELGFTGVIGGRARVAIDAYRSRVTGLTGQPRAETPNAFFEAASLGAYLGQFLPPAQASTIAGLVSSVPVGTIAPREAPDPADIVFTFRNFGAVTLWGADFDVTVDLTSWLSTSGTYSWTSNDFFPNVAGVADLALNAPANKASLSVRLAAPGATATLDLRARYVAGFPVNSGVYVGAVERYTVVDLTLGCRFPWLPAVRLSVEAQNALDQRHREFVGAPMLGRLVIAGVRATF